ncbi:hypothetical protein GUJ93_ZPchr0004g40077 [Zizania palustris]|uniref:Uncharacterized protein n=1 Tax=Zizania palustris TaxID=103762 RepID=A0A8J5V8N4_ZIZPA|nr:hypothetical protein GUJ93_ZPchr0004g40077 [Zizania palustris]
MPGGVTIVSCRGDIFGASPAVAEALAVALGFVGTGIGNKHKRRSACGPGTTRVASGQARCERPWRGITRATHGEVGRSAEKEKREKRNVVCGG